MTFIKTTRFNLTTLVILKVRLQEKVGKKTFNILLDDINNITRLIFNAKSSSK